MNKFLDALRAEIINAVPELAGQVWPGSAPKSHSIPYAIYVNMGEIRERYLNSLSQPLGVRVMLNVFERNYDAMRLLRHQAEKFLLGLRFVNIGAEGEWFVNHAEIGTVTETYENEISLHRGIIDFEVFF